MNKIRIKSFELLHQLLNMKFKEDNNKDYKNDDGISYIAYDGNTGNIQVYIDKNKELPNGNHYYTVPPENMYTNNDNDIDIRKEIFINGVQYIQFITKKRFLQEKDNIPQERIRYYE